MTLPNDAVTIRFPASSEAESYQLIELPAEILKAVEGGATVPLTIKGRPSDDAVLCTQNKTWALRNVSISNSLMILRPPIEATSSAELHIRDICHDVLECVPAAGRTDRIRSVLRDSAWRGLGVDMNTPLKAGVKRKRDKRYTREQLCSIVQASDEEMAVALRDNNVVEVDGHMLLLPPVQLGELLELVLSLLTIHSDGKVGSDRPARVRTPSDNIVDPLAQDHDVPRDLGLGVMGLFGELEEGDWFCDVTGVVRELGRGLLVKINDTNRPSDEFLAEWRTNCGETWAPIVSLDLLTGDHLLSDPPASAFAASSPLISYFPTHALPTHPPTRFADLFLTRTRWRPQDMEPFLRGLYTPGDTKARDKLVAKFVRVVKDRDGTWWYPRRTG